MAINLNGADHSQFNRDEKNTNVARSAFSDTYTTAFTLNEGEIVPCYRGLLTPNANLEKSETYVMYQSPLATRNFSNQRVYTHSFSMPVKNMWHEWREAQFGGRYQDNETPILHFYSAGNTGVNKVDALVAASVYCDYFPRGSLADHIGGVQTDVHLTDNLTPNPWLFFLYLTVYKYYFLNQPLLRGDKKWRRIWFPTSEEKWSFEVGDYNRKTGKIGRFWSPEHRSGLFVTTGNPFKFTNGTLTFTIRFHDCATGYFLIQDGTFVPASQVVGSAHEHSFSVDLPYPDVSNTSDFIRLNHQAVTDVVLDYLANLDNPVCVLDLFETRYRNFRNDYYMSGLPSPLMVPTSNGQGATGKAGKPSINVDDISMDLDVSALTDNLLMKHVFTESGYNHPLQSKQYSQNSSKDMLVTDNAGFPSTAQDYHEVSVGMYSSEFRDYISKLRVVGNVGLSLDMDALRLLSATTMYLEALTRSDGDYSSNVRAIYGVTPLELDLKPRYLGGTASNVYSMDVVQTAPQGSAQDTVLGSVTQRGQAGHKGGFFRHFTKDTEVVLTLMSVVPDSVYCQGIDRRLTARSPLDIPNPMFMGLGMDAVLNYELYVSGDDSVDLAPLAYQGAWDFYRFRRNEVHDLMIPVFDDYGTLMNKPFTQMNQIRYFSETPTLSEDLVTTKGNISHEHLMVTDTNVTPEYSVIVSNSGNVVLPLTKYAKGQGL